jgi:hypothetical protein
VPEAIAVEKEEQNACQASAGLATGDMPRRGQRQEDAQKRAQRDGGVAPRAPPVVLCPNRPLLPAVSRYWHWQAYLVEAVVRQAWTCR